MFRTQCNTYSTVTYSLNASFFLLSLLLTIVFSEGTQYERNNKVISKMKHALHLNRNSKDSKQKVIAFNNKRLKKVSPVVTETGDDNNPLKIDSAKSKTSSGERSRKGNLAHLAESTKENEAIVTSPHFNWDTYTQKYKKNSEATLMRSNFGEDESKTADATDIEGDNVVNNNEDYIIYSRIGSEDDENTLEQNDSNEMLETGQETDNGNISDTEPYEIQYKYTTALDLSEDYIIHQSQEPVTDFHAIEDTSMRQEQWDIASHYSTDYEIQTNLNEYASGLLKRIPKSAYNPKSNQSDLPDENSSSEETEKFAEEKIDGKNNVDSKSIEKVPLVQDSVGTEIEDYVEKNQQYQSKTYYDDSKDMHILTTPVAGGVAEGEAEFESESSIENVVIQNNDQETSISENRLVALKTLKKKNLGGNKFYKHKNGIKGSRDWKFRVKEVKLMQIQKPQSKPQTGKDKKIKGAEKSSKLHKHNNGIKDNRDWKFQAQKMMLKPIQKSQSKPQTGKGKKINGAEKRRLTKYNRLKAIDRFLHTLPRESSPVLQFEQEDSDKYTQIQGNSPNEKSEEKEATNKEKQN
ncbi:hypothetical protein TNIN_335331 [Trichonephila inaurata madagascariensis]|uniref:Uncharacterized protein n=1 Tax=Trichonephila inaurata madagascariensis TaxID=2747483 RepID=A0A8X6JBE5_9ARAC|nr:hypothetical protein TNIN_335331 [Trichonephila inaurata madagascariensis]